MNYKEKLEKIWNGQKDDYRTFLAFVGEEIFGFTTYDDAAATLIAEKMVEVCRCILDKSTFDYQEKSKEHYMAYLTMVNMPFLCDMLEWGISIRGAWFDDYGDHRTKGAKRHICYDLEIPISHTTKFMSQLLDWIQEKQSNKNETT